MLNHQGTILIRAKRLVLRRFTFNDADNMFNNWSSDSDICKHMRWHPHKSKEETRKQIGNWIDCYSKESFYQWAVTLEGNDEPIGAIGLFTINESDLCVDVAYCIGREYWGQGIATEALKAVISFAFDVIGFNRIEAYHSINNPASGRVMQKSGMVFEGLARQKYKSISGFEDSNMYSILKSDFERNCCKYNSADCDI